MKTRSLHLSRVRQHFQKKSDRQTGKQTKFFKMKYESAVSSSKCLLYYSKTYNYAKECPENNFVANEWMDRLTNGLTDQLTKKWF